MVITVVIFAVLALAAVAFAIRPLLGGGRAGWILASSVAAIIVGVGIGLYLVLGAPELAVRALKGPAQNDWKGQIARLVENARAHPGDETAWRMLGLGYMTINDGQDAAAAFRRALTVARPADEAFLLSRVGMALVMAQGTVTPEAEEAFGEALRRDPHDAPSRLYLGLAYASRHDSARALMLWQSLLADTPANAPLHQVLVDRIAMLTLEGGGARPDPTAMVAGLAARLKDQPNDAEGWQRLVRSYVVLGDAAKAKAALADARAALKANGAAEAALDAEAKQLGLEK
ncbi:MAG TPA: hypothetical protein VGG48_16325 [Rhizomicrobium sp.]|jgi:cytochrome c-type biogenesis protein CcmH